MLDRFENIVRQTKSLVRFSSGTDENIHPFDERNLHIRVQDVSKKLFDDGHYSQATFEAYKLVDKEVSAISQSCETGYKLMMSVFNKDAPKIKLNHLGTTSEKDEQDGFRHIFSGAVLAIRNPRGHDYDIKESPTECLDHLSLASLLMRRLEDRK